MISQLVTGAQNNGDGTITNQRSGKQGETIISELHGRFYEQTYRGNLFCFGGVSTALTSTNATATGLTASATPIIGVWNPPTSAVNLVILQATVMITNMAVSTVSPASFVWVSATGQNNITTGSTPVNRKTLLSAGSQTKAFALGTALTGLVGSLTNTTVPLNVPTVVFAEPASGQTAGMIGAQSLENIDGSWIVPPGGFLGIMGTTSTTTVSVTSSILWEEVPV